MASQQFNLNSIPGLIRASNDGTLYNRSVLLEGEKANGFKPFGDDGLSFADVLDVVNPLQHIPILGHIPKLLENAVS